MEIARKCMEMHQTTDVDDSPVHEIKPGCETFNAYNVGNPVFTCDARVSSDLPSQSEHSKCCPGECKCEWKRGYGEKSSHLMYATSNSEYGARAPNVNTVPMTHNPMSQMFSNHLGKCGMYRNHSLNTSIEHSPVPDHVRGHIYY